MKDKCMKIKGKNIIVKTSLNKKQSMLAENFLLSMINHLNSYIMDNRSDIAKLCDGHVIYEWNYEVYVETLLNNKYRVTIIEYNDYRPIGKITYDWNISKEKIQQLYALSKINEKAYKDEINIVYKDEINE